MIPVNYDWKNIFASEYSPSTIHSQDSQLTAFFRKYLFQKAISVFHWELPTNWDKAYTLAGLYMRGYISVIETDKYGIIPQWCELQGYNVFYQPTNAVIANPLLRGATRPIIGKQCALIKLTPFYSGIWDIISYYANLLAQASQSLQMNLINSRWAYVFAAQNKTQAESFKKMFDEIQAGNPAAFIDKQLFNDDGSPAWLNFINNLRANYIASDILQNLKQIEASFDTEIGIPNVQTEKKERLITDEVTSNNVETASKCELWLEEINRGIDQVNEVFSGRAGTISVTWRVDPVQEGGAYDGTKRDPDSARAV